MLLSIYLLRMLKNPLSQNNGYDFGLELEIYYDQHLRFTVTNVSKIYSIYIPRLLFFWAILATKACFNSLRIRILEQSEDFCLFPHFY